MRVSTLMKAALTAVLCICLPAVAAGQTTINFDSLGCPSTLPGLVVTNQFAGVGVSSFSSSLCFSPVISLAGQSPPSALWGDLTLGMSPISFDFSFAVPFASIVGLDVGDNGLQLECFSATGGGGSSLGSQSFVGTGIGVGNSSTLTVTAAGIRSCTVSQTSSVNGSDGYAIDDLMFPVELQSFSVE